MTFVLSILLARIFSPSELGVYSMALVLINIAHVFRDFGVSGYLQREPDLDSFKIRSAIGVLFISSWLLAAILFFSAGWVARWLREPEVTSLVQVLAIGFLFIPFGSVTTALLSREFAADKQAIIVVAGMVSYCASCLCFALMGMGTISMAWANLVNVIVTALACIPYHPKGVSWIPSFKHARGVVTYGLGALLSNLISNVNNAVPDLMLGRIGSARLVGLLSRANSTVSMFSYIAGTTVTYGALSYLSQTYHRGESLVPTLSRATALLTGIGWPALALTAAFGHDIILTLYGEKWLSCVEAILPISIAAAFSMMYHYLPTTLMAIGRPYLGAVSIIVTIVSRIAFGLALFNGTLQSFAWAICLATIAAIPVMIWQQKHLAGFGFRATCLAALPSAVVTLVCVFAAMGFRMLLPDSVEGLKALLIMFLPLALVWYVALRLTQHVLVDEVHRMGIVVKTRIMQLRSIPNT